LEAPKFRPSVALGRYFLLLSAIALPSACSPSCDVATSGSGTTAVNVGSIVRCRKKTRFARSDTIKTLHKVQQFQGHDMSLFMIYSWRKILFLAVLPRRW
jgi:hypothetical protein